MTVRLRVIVSARYTGTFEQLMFPFKKTAAHQGGEGRISTGDMGANSRKTRQHSFAQTGGKHLRTGRTTENPTSFSVYGIIERIATDHSPSATWFDISIYCPRFKTLQKQFLLITPIFNAHAS